MVNIKLPGNYLILSEKYCWIIAKQEKDRIVNLTYHTTLQSALKSFLDMKIRLSECNSIFSLIEYQKQLITGCNKTLQGFEIEIKTKNEVKN